MLVCDWPVSDFSLLSDLSCYRCLSCICPVEFFSSCRFFFFFFPFLLQSLCVLRNISVFFFFSSLSSSGSLIYFFSCYLVIDNWDFIYLLC